MSGKASAQFLEHLRRMSPAAPDDKATVGDRTARLWELVDLPADTFANEAARFCGLDRVSLQDLLAAAPAAGDFSQRFLREVLAYPYRAVDGKAVLAMADPTDYAARRAAELVLGPAIAFRVASSEESRRRVRSLRLPLSAGDDRVQAVAVEAADRFAIEQGGDPVRTTAVSRPRRRALSRIASATASAPTDSAEESPGTKTRAVIASSAERRRRSRPGGRG